MASRDEREGAKFTRDEIDKRARVHGHDMAWKLGPLATRKGQAYFFEGTCGNCGATASAGSMWSSCSTHRDARAVVCSGRGTAILTEVEAARVSELIADAVADFGRAVRNNIRRDTSPYN
jgi:hypothetical protein